MRIIFRFCMLMPLVLSNVILAQCSKPVENAEPVTGISLSAVQDTVKAGDPLWIEATMKNISNHDISVWRDSSENFNIQVYDAKGYLASDTKYGYAKNGHADLSRLRLDQLSTSGACVTMKPGETFTQKENVGLLYDLSEHGKYTILAQRSDPASAIIVKSNTIRVTVSP